MTVKQAIEAMERIASTSVTKGWTVQNDDDLRLALAILRSLKSATEEEVWKLADAHSNALERVTNWYCGFRAAERRIFGE